MKKTFKISAGIIGDEELANKAKWNEYGTSKIPPRPFVGHAADYINEEFVKGLIMAAIEGNATEMDIQQNNIGKQMVGNIRAAILASNYLPNAPSTVKKKGFNFPLIETGKMYMNLKYKKGDR